MHKGELLPCDWCHDAKVVGRDNIGDGVIASFELIGWRNVAVLYSKSHISGSLWCPQRNMSSLKFMLQSFHKQKCIQKHTRTHVSKVRRVCTYIITEFHACGCFLNSSLPNTHYKWSVATWTALCVGYTLKTRAVRLRSLLVRMKTQKLFWQNFSSKIYLMGFKFVQGSQWDGERQRESERAGLCVSHCACSCPTSV